MGQLRDFTMETPQRQSRRTVTGRPRRRKTSLWLKQVVWSCILFAMVSATVKLDNDFGNTVQQMLFDHLSMETDLLPVLQPLYSGKDGGSQNQYAIEDNQEDTALQLLVPISGIVLKNFAATEDGNMVVTGITIKTPNGGRIISACDGQVATIAGDVGNWTVTMTYGERWKTEYRGLKNLSVTAGQYLPAGTVLGDAVEGEMIFSLYDNDRIVDPMPYFGVDETGF